MTSDVMVIVEAGVNHNGSPERALEMIEVASNAGADAIKFQTFSADRLARKDARLADYQRTSASDGRSQWDLLKGLELSHDDFIAIRQRCDELGIAFMSTGFDLAELRFLVSELSVPFVKVASGDLTFAPMLFEAGLSGLPIILSTGMADLDEIEQALSFIAVGIGVSAEILPPDAVPTREYRAQARADPRTRELVTRHVTILHCTTQYPAPLESLNLRAMVSIAKAFDTEVGYSDHSLGNLASIVAVSLGATVLEKHFTLDKSLEGPDHSASLDPGEMEEFVAQVRKAGAVLGSDVKECQEVEQANRNVVRRSIVAVQPIRRGQVISHRDVECQRPASGRTAFDFWEVVGTRAQRDVAVGGIP